MAGVCKYVQMLSTSTYMQIIPVHMEANLALISVDDIIMFPDFSK